MYKILSVFSILLLYSTFTSADVDCTGKVTSLTVQLDTVGVVTLALEGGPNMVNICGVASLYNNVSPEACKAMYATLMAAKLSNKKILMRFYGNYTSCAAIPAWIATPVGWNQVLID